MMDAEDKCPKTCGVCTLPANVGSSHCGAAGAGSTSGSTGSTGSTSGSAGSTGSTGSTSGSTGTTAPTAAPAAATEVKGSMEMTFSKAGFKDDTAAQAEVAQGLAALLGVDASWITLVVTLVTGGRRLEATPRVLATEKVKVDYTITVPAGNTVAAADVKTALETKTTTDVQTAVQAKLTAATSLDYTVTVDSKAVPTMATVTAAPTPAVTTPPNEGVASGCDEQTFKLGAVFLIAVMQKVL